MKKNATLEQKKRAAEHARRWRAKNKEKVREMNAKRYKTPEQKKAKSEDAKRYYATNAGKASKAKLRMKKYGISPTQRQEILISQIFCCGICGEPESKTFHVDHNHQTGKVRGLLCHRCNVGLGMFRENPQVLVLAIQYLGRL